MIIAAKIFLTILSLAGSLCFGIAVDSSHRDCDSALGSLTTWLGLSILSVWLIWWVV